ncbi:hypothetical protein M8C21_011407, partial [Ambrosia artemisiifolia]
VEDFNVVAPRLKNLNISATLTHNNQCLISAPVLEFLIYKVFSGLPLSTNDFLSLEKADICVSCPKDAHQVLRLLQQLHNVKFLTLNLEIVEAKKYSHNSETDKLKHNKLLSSSVELMSYQPSPFVNLKSLKIHPAGGLLEVPKRNTVRMSMELKSYLLDSSPGATLTMVSREDVRAMKDTKFAQDLITELRELLEREKARIETKMAKMHEQGRPQVSGHIGTYIDMCWKSTSARIKKGKEKVYHIFSRLQDIKGLLTELPASNQATILPSFSALCAEFDIVMNKITECIKMDCDEDQRRLSVCLHELATTLLPSAQQSASP